MAGWGVVDRSSLPRRTTRQAARPSKDRPHVITWNEGVDGHYRRRGSGRGRRMARCTGGDAACPLNLPRGRCPWRRHCNERLARRSEATEPRGGDGRIRANVHQQTRLAAGAIADDDELPAEFSRHGCWCPKGIAWLARRKADEAGTGDGISTGDGRCVKVAASREEGRRARSGHRGIRVLAERCEVRSARRGMRR